MVRTAALLEDYHYGNGDVWADILVEILNENGLQGGNVRAAHLYWLKGLGVFCLTEGIHGVQDALIVEGFQVVEELCWHLVEQLLPWLDLYKLGRSLTFLQESTLFQLGKFDHSSKEYRVLEWCHDFSSGSVDVHKVLHISATSHYIKQDVICLHIHHFYFRFLY